MKASFIVGGLVGYVLGARAGRERYEQLVAVGRRIAGSQTVQATAGVLQAQANDIAGRARGKLAGKIPLIGHPSDYSASATNSGGANGHRYRG
ncbi:hypothetical protein ACSMXN_17195 [Jatrophihabitans sp. DSM 45814]